MPSVVLYYPVLFYCNGLYKLWPQFIYLPNNNECVELNRDLLHYGNHKIDALKDGCHIEITNRAGVKEFFNRKRRCGLNWIFVTDCKERFRYGACN